MKWGQNIWMNSYYPPGWRLQQYTRIKNHIIIQFMLEKWWRERDGVRVDQRVRENVVLHRGMLHLLTHEFGMHK